MKEEIKFNANEAEKGKSLMGPASGSFPRDSYQGKSHKEKTLEMLVNQKPKIIEVLKQLDFIKDDDTKITKEHYFKIRGAKKTFLGHNDLHTPVTDFEDVQNSLSLISADEFEKLMNE